MAAIPNGITRDDVLTAARALDAGAPHEFGESTTYDVIVDGKPYPPKAIIGLAAARILGHPLGPYDFTGGLKSRCFAVLDDLKFPIIRKAAASVAGGDWDEDEIRVLVADYFEMLRKERAGIPYSKAEHNRALQAQLSSRGRGSIEFKYQNVSGVLYDSGYVYIEGYKPARNYQRRMLPEIVLEHIGEGGDDVQAIEASVETVNAAPAAVVDLLGCEVSPPARGDDEAEPGKSGPKVRKARRFDFARRDAANRKLGEAGEEFVIKVERAKLTASGRGDLAGRVERVSLTLGDGLGFDVRSFDAVTGEEVCIEVKTTNCDINFPFYLTNNEVDASVELGDRFRLYRVFQFSTEPRYFVVVGDLRAAFSLKARTYEARRA